MAAGFDGSRKDHCMVIDGGVGFLPVVIAPGSYIPLWVTKDSSNSFCE